MVEPGTRVRFQSRWSSDPGDYEFGVVAMQNDDGVHVQVDTGGFALVIEDNLTVMGES